MAALSSERTLCLRDWGRTGLALLIAGCLHAAWLFMDLSVPERTHSRMASRLVLLEEQASGGWSPTLFSLPSLTGFSGAMRDEGVQSVPPLQSPIQLTESIRFDRPKQDLVLPDLAIDQPSLTRPVFAREEAHAEPAAASSGWLLEFPEAPGLVVQKSRVPSALPVQSGFELRGDLSFDASGRVESLVIHPPIPEDAVTLEAVQSLRRIRSTQGYTTGRYRFRYVYGPIQEEMP